MLPDIERTANTDNGHIDEPFSSYDDPTLDDLDAVRRAVIDAGVDLSKANYQNYIAAKRGKAREIALRDAPGQPPAWFYQLRSVIQSAGNAILLVVMLLLSYVALPVAILGLAYAEIQRVSLGVALFDPPRAGLMALVAVSSYLILLVVQAANRHNAPDTQRPLWSLRLWASQTAYTLGIRRQWVAQYQTEGQRLHKAIARLGWLIILLGTAGSLADELAATSGAWYEAIGNIVLHSDLMTFLALAGGISLTAGLLAALHFAVGLAYSKWMQIMPDGGADFLADSFDTSESEDRAELHYLLSLLQKTQDNS